MSLLLIILNISLVSKLNRTIRFYFIYTNYSIYSIVARKEIDCIYLVLDKYNTQEKRDNRIYTYLNI